jgi:hypothetical protein
MRNSLAALTQSHLEALEQQQFEEQHGASFGSSTSCTGTNPSSQGKGSGLGVGFGLGIDIHDKPLPGVPQSHFLNMEAKSSSRLVPDISERFRTGPEEEPPIVDLVGFSFNPGDDTSILAQEAKHEVKRKKRKEAGVYARPNRSPIASIVSQQHSESSPTADTPPRPMSETPVQKQIRKSIAIANAAIARETQESDSPRRDDSISSIVTAVRDNSGRSSTTGSIRNSQSGRQRLDRSTGNSSEAVTAAVRALAAMNMKGKMTGSRFYGEGSGGSSRGSGERRSVSASYEEKREESRRGSGEAVRNVRNGGKTHSGASSIVSTNIALSEPPLKKQEKRSGE